MATLPLNQAAVRFIENENRYNTFINGGEDDSYEAIDHTQVPSVRKLFRSLEDQVADLIVSAPVTVSTRETAASLDLSEAEYVVVNRWNSTALLHPSVYVKVASTPAHEAYLTDAKSNIFELKTTYVDIRACGAVPGAATAAEAKACADAINLAYTVAAETTGRLVIPAATWVVHVNAEDLDSSASSSSYRVAALQFSRDNVLVESVPGAVVKCFATAGDYGVIQLSQGPITNGDYEISGGGLLRLTLDGNCADTASYEGNSSVIIAEGLRDYTIQTCEVLNSGGYGIGLQNGGYVNVTVSDIIFDNIAKDAVDIKNNISPSTSTSTGFGVKVRDITLRDVCRAYDSDPSAMIDVMGAGILVENVMVEKLPSTTGTNYASVVRVKQGAESIGRGLGGQAAIVRNVTVKWDGGFGPGVGIVDVRAPYVTVDNVRQYGTPPDGVVGVFLSQAFCLVTGGNVSNLYRGVFCQSRLGGGEEWPFEGADDCTILGVTMRNCTGAAVWSVRDRVRVLFNSMNGSAMGAGLVASGSQVATDCVVIGNDMTDVTTPFPFNDGNGMIAHSNIGAMDFKSFSLMESGKAQHALLAVAKTLRFGVGLTDVGEPDAVREVMRAYSSAGTLADTVNRVEIVGTQTGQAPRVAVAGGDANIDLGLYPKGDGRIKLGALKVAGSDAPITGYIEVKDSGGNIRKLAIID